MGGPHHNGDSPGRVMKHVSTPSTSSSCHDIQHHINLQRREESLEMHTVALFWLLSSFWCPMGSATDWLCLRSQLQSEAGPAPFAADHDAGGGTAVSSSLL